MIDQQVVHGTEGRSQGVSGTTFALLASVCLTAVWQVSKLWKFHKLPLERQVLLMFTFYIVLCPSVIINLAFKLTENV